MLGVNIWIYFLSGMHADCVLFHCLCLQVMWTKPAMFFFFFFFFYSIYVVAWLNSVFSLSQSQSLGPGPKGAAAS